MSAIADMSKRALCANDGYTRQKTGRRKIQNKPIKSLLLCILLIHLES